MRGDVLFLALVTAYATVLIAKLFEGTLQRRLPSLFPRAPGGAQARAPAPRAAPLQVEGIPQPLPVESAPLPTPPTSAGGSQDSTRSSAGVGPAPIGRGARYLESCPPGASAGERHCAETLARLLPGRRALYQYRDPAIANPDTGCALELDVYYPELRLAVEYNGAQHYEDSAHFQSAAAPQMARDHIKAAAARRLGITLVVIPHTYSRPDAERILEAHARAALAALLRHDA